MASWLRRPDWIRVGGAPGEHRPPGAVGVGLGALVGAIAACRALDPQFITGVGGKWIRPENDYNAYLVAWHYYIVDAWRLPLFSIPAMGYPEGGSVLFNDALPLAALLTKVIYHVAGVPVNPFGWWLFLTYVLQGAMAARLVRAVGVPSGWACVAGAVLALTNTAFVWRMPHTALAGHFLVLWALALHFESLRRGRAKVGESGALLATALLVNPYLFAMVWVLESVTLLALGIRGQLTRRDVQWSAAGMGAVAALGLVAGYGILLVNPSLMKSQGFGHLSWNLVGLLVPPDGVFGFLAGVPRDATGGQYEGEAYLGRGALLLVVVAAASAPGPTLRQLRRYWVLAGALVGLALYAASNVVYLGSMRVVAFELPAVALDLASYFRATGRFIWPLAYVLAILPVAGIARRWPAAPAVAVAALAVGLQLWESAPSYAFQRRTTAQAYPELLDTRRLDDWLRRHQRLWQYPSWACGGLAGPRSRWGSREDNRELQVQLAAARAGVPTNSVYTSRLLKDCAAEKGWSANPRLEEGVLYVVSLDAARAPGALATLARSGACVTLEWAVVCSRQWSRTAAGAAAISAAQRERS